MSESPGASCKELHRTGVLVILCTEPTAALPDPRKPTLTLCLLCAAVCQRKLEQAFPGLVQQQEHLLAKLQAFHKEHVAEGFALADYVMDVYVTSSGAVSPLLSCCLSSLTCAEPKLLVRSTAARSDAYVSS